MKTTSSAVVTIDRCRRALYASALSDYLATAGRASTPIAIVDDDAAVGDVLRRARAANASQVAVTTRSGETHATIEHRCVSMRDIARAWIDNATHEVEDRWFFEEYRVRDIPSTMSMIEMEESKTSTMNLLDVCALMSRSRSVVVVLKNGVISEVVTKFDVCRFLAEKMAVLGEVANVPAASIFESKRIVSELFTVTAQRCVERMLAADVSAIALADERVAPTEYIGCFSFNDFRRIDTPRDLSAMRSMSVIEFVSRKRVDTFVDGGGSAIPFESGRFDQLTHHYIELVYIKSDATLSELLTEFAERGIHHVFILACSKPACSESPDAYGVVTPTDVVARLAPR